MTTISAVNIVLITGPSFGKGDECACWCAQGNVIWHGGAA